MGVLIGNDSREFELSLDVSLGIDNYVVGKSRLLVEAVSVFFVQFVWNYYLMNILDACLYWN